MSWVHEMAGWLSDKLVRDEAEELDRMSILLRSELVDSRLSAVRALTYTKAADAVPLLIGALRDGDATVRAAAAGAVGYKASRDAVTSLAVLLGDTDAEARVAAVKALDEIGLPRPRSWAQFWRDKIAVQVEDKRVADLLARALADPEMTVRAAALAVLPRHGARGVQVVRAHLSSRPTADPLERNAAEPELIRALDGRDPDHRQAAVEALHHLYGERAVRALAEALRDSHANVRKAAVEAVTALGPQPALKELLERLDDPNEGVVVRVVEGLVLAHNMSAFVRAEADQIHERLLRLARKGEPQAQAAAAWALGQMGRVAAVGTLCELLTEQDEAVLAAAAESLGKINDARAVAPLMALVERGGPPKALAAAIRSLAAAQDVRAVPVLVRALFAESRPEVEQALEAAMGALCGPVVDGARTSLQQAEVEPRLQAVRQAISEPRLVLELMGQVLEAPDPTVRAAALDVLSRQGYDLPALTRTTLTLEDKSESRRILAIHLMQALQLEDTVAHLDHLLADQNEPFEVYRHAVAALKRIDSEAARSALKARVDDPREAVRGLVREALGSS